MAGERTRLQALQAERVATTVRARLIGRVDPAVTVECLEGLAAREATDGLPGRLVTGWWDSRRTLARGVDRDEALAAATAWLAPRGAVAVVLGGALDVGPLTVPHGLAAPVLDVVLAVDGEEVWLFPPGDEAPLVEPGGEGGAGRVDVWVVACRVEGAPGALSPVSAEPGP